MLNQPCESEQNTTRETKYWILYTDQLLSHANPYIVEQEVQYFLNSIVVNIEKTYGYINLESLVIMNLPDKTPNQRSAMQPTHFNHHHQSNPTFIITTFNVFLEMMRINYHGRDYLSLEKSKKLTCYMRHHLKIILVCTVNIHLFFLFNTVNIHLNFQSTHYFCFCLCVLII